MLDFGGLGARGGCVVALLQHARPPLVEHPLQRRRGGRLRGRARLVELGLQRALSRGRGLHRSVRLVLGSHYLTLQKLTYSIDLSPQLLHHVLVARRGARSHLALALLLESRRGLVRFRLDEATPQLVELDTSLNQRQLRRRIAFVLGVARRKEELRVGVRLGLLAELHH